MESWLCAVQVSDLDPNDVQAAVDEAHRHNYKMLKSRPNDDVVQALKSDLDNFKEQLPLLQEVCVPDMNTHLPLQALDCMVIITTG